MGLCRFGTAMEEVRLSPSRISDYQQCPKLYNYRVIQKLPEPISLDAERGTLVHSVLEELMAQPTHDRTFDFAHSRIQNHWQLQLENRPGLSELVPDQKEWMDRVTALLQNYFQLENPQIFQPTHIEEHLELPANNSLLLHGYVDRIDVAPTGEVRIVDYKTGKSPKPGYEDKALFQLRFYGLLWFRIKNVVPKLLQLLYLGDAQTIRSYPTESDLLMAERKALKIGEDILISHEKDFWPTQKSRLCDWCSFKKICPAFNS